jgi:hypothetical protein
VQHPWSPKLSDSLPVFTKLNPEKNGFSVRDWIPHDKPRYLNGKFQIFLMDDDGPGGKPYYVYEGWKGSGKTPFTVEGTHIFAPWTNPGPDSSSNISIVVRDSIDGSIKVSCFVEEIILTEDTVFPPGGLYFTHNLIVPEGITLTINRKTSLKFSKGSSLIVEGKLIDYR